MENIVVLGTQWGDEGKGKITDYLTSRADVVVRYQGGNNAGHTVKFDGKKYALHLLPSGILNPKAINVMANGMVINPEAFYNELSKLENSFNLYISDRAHIVLPYHIEKDKRNETKDNIGTTHKGIGPTYEDKYGRRGVRVVDFVGPHNKEILTKKFEENKAYLSNVDINDLVSKYLELANFMKPYVKDTSYLLNEMVHTKKILFEGAQGVLLCIDHGTYPYVTSSSPTAASIPINTGLAPWFIKGAIGVTKAYSTRVGNGPFPSELFGELADKIRIIGNEFGTTTGRPRRIGWLDTVVINYSKRVSGISTLAITLLDVLTGLDEIKIVTKYMLDGNEIDTIPASVKDFERCKPLTITLPGWKEDITQVKSFDELPTNAKNYIKKIEELTGIPVSIVSVGPDRTQTIEVKPVL